MSDTAQEFSKFTDLLMTRDASLSLISELGKLKDLSYTKDNASLVSDFINIMNKFPTISSSITPGTSQTVVLNYIDSLIKYLENVEIVELTLSFHPTATFLVTLYSWFKSHLESSLLLKVQVDEDLGGGVLVSYRGNYVDLSLKKTLTDYFVSNKEYVSARL